MSHYENGYWRCKSGQHLWVEKEDADLCCQPNCYRIMTTLNDVKKGERFSPASIPGMVFVWRKDD